jgi:hypothetical protein
MRPRRILLPITLFLLISSAVTLRAQNTDALDTAPGVGVKASPLTPQVTQTAPATGPSFVRNGDFSTPSKDPAFPEGWTWDKSAPISWESESSSHYLRLVSRQPGQVVQVVRTIPIPSGVKGLEATCRYRIANFKFGTSFARDMKFTFHFADPAGKSLSSSSVVLNSHTKTWGEITKQVLVPNGAVNIVLSPLIDGAASGTLDIQEIRLVPMAPADAAKISAAAAAETTRKEAVNTDTLKKREADAILVQQILALPPKTVEIKVSGNKLVTGDGTPVWLQGVNVPSLEWSAKGENILQSIKVAMDEWKANAIRLPVQDSYWFGQGKNQAPGTQEQYRQIVDNAVKMASARGAYIILDLHRFLAPEDGSVAFWKDAAARYKNNPAVLFDIFNEPHGISWEVWRNGGEVQEKQKGNPQPRVFHSPGMQGLVEAVRGTGAKNIIVAGGLDYAFDLTGIVNGYALEDKTGNGIMYATHFYNWHRGWQKHFLLLADKYPLLVGETGADVHKMSFIPAQAQEDPYTWVPNMLGLVQKYHLNWTGFSLHPAATPVLISDWTYAPTPFWGAFAKDALAGKQFELKNLR